MGTSALTLAGRRKDLPLSMEGLVLALLQCGFPVTYEQNCVVAQFRAFLSAVAVFVPSKNTALWTSCSSEAKRNWYWGRMWADGLLLCRNSAVATSLNNEIFL